MFFFPSSSHLQSVAELEVQAEEIFGQKTEGGGQTAGRGDQVNSLQNTYYPHERLEIILSLPNSWLTILFVFFSLSSDEEEDNSEDEAGEKKEEGEEEEEEGDEEEDEEAEMERKLAQLKAEEVAELKRYDTFSFLFNFLFVMTICCLNHNLNFLLHSKENDRSPFSF